MSFAGLPPSASKEETEEFMAYLQFESVQSSLQ
jgi:hypothetical protein